MSDRWNRLGPIALWRCHSFRGLPPCKAISPSTGVNTVHVVHGYGRSTQKIAAWSLHPERVVALMHPPDHSGGRMKPTTTDASYQREYLDLQERPHPAVTPVMRNDRGMFFFDPGLLDAVAETYEKSFATAAPFPHVVVDGLFPQQVVDGVLKEFPEPSARSDWIRLYDETSAKLALSQDWTMGPSTRHLLNQFNSAAFVNFLEHLSGIEGLIPDPHYGGGGLHQMERGGYLKIHADFNRHGRLGLDRRLTSCFISTGTGTTGGAASSSYGT